MNLSQQPRPWAVLHRTPGGQAVYIVHDGPDGGQVSDYHPITRNDGSVRVEYVSPDGRQTGHFGWEPPNSLTAAG